MLKFSEWLIFLTFFEWQVPNGCYSTRQRLTQAISHTLIFSLVSSLFHFPLYCHWEAQPILPSENNTKELNTAEFKKKEGERWESRNPSTNGLSWMKLNIQINAPSPWPKRNFSQNKATHTHTHTHTHTERHRDTLTQYIHTFNANIDDKRKLNA